MQTCTFHIDLYYPLKLATFDLTEDLRFNTRMYIQQIYFTVSYLFIIIFLNNLQPGDTIKIYDP